MYNVSQEYKDELQKNIFKFDLFGRLTGTGDFYGDNILAGSLTINKQCSSGNKIIMGSTYASELKATFVDTNAIDIGATITLSEGMYVDSLDRYEYVPIGAFKVAEAVKTRSGIVVTAYDYMSKFNKKAALASVSGSVFEWLRYCCSMCNVTMAQTQAQIEALPNGTAQLTCYIPDGFECTYRDVVSYLAQIIGGFATMDRDGELVLVSYEPTAYPVAQIGANGRFGNDSSFAMYTTNWDAVSYLDVSSGTDETVVVGTATSEETTFSLGFNPFMQNPADAAQIALTLLNVAESMTYVPFKIKVASGACYDLGDTLTQMGGLTPNPITSRYLITSITWTYNGGTALEGAGADVSVGSGGYSSSTQPTGGGGQTYNDFTGATASVDGSHGLVPAPLIADREKFLCGDGTWRTVQSGAGERELTEAEYEALSYAEKMNGTTYYITDLIGAGGVNGSSPLVDYGNPIIENVGFYGSTSYTATENCYVFLYLVRSSTAVFVGVDGTEFPVAYGLNSNGDSFSCYLKAGQVLTVRGASSSGECGIWVFPLLGNSYSTTEHKTGRKWIDGKDIWEKTYVLNSTDISGRYINVDVSALNIDTCVHVGGICDRIVPNIGKLTYEFNSYEADYYRTYVAYSDFNKVVQYFIRYSTGESTTQQIITLQYTKV